jgi:hypothetical protein
MPKKEKEALAGQFMQRVQQILSVESINSEPAVIAELIMKYFPDFRRTLNELQRYSNFGKIDSGILVGHKDVAIADLMEHLKLKNFKLMRQWVADNIDVEPASMFRKVYDNMNEYVEPQSIPQLVLILADYQYKNSFVADHELNMVACLTEVMAGVKFK